MTLTETQFHGLADATLNRLAEWAEAQDDEGVLEADLISGILTIELPDGKSFVVSKHSTSQQLWLSSPLSGGLHFAYDGEYWSLPDGRRLDTLLKAELEEMLED